MYISVRPCMWITCIYMGRRCVVYTRNDRRWNACSKGEGRVVCIYIYIYLYILLHTHTCVRAHTRTHRRGLNIDVLLIIKILIRTSHNVYYTVGEMCAVYTYIIYTYMLYICTLNEIEYIYYKHAR
jgi:hypothetical protein